MDGKMPLKALTRIKSKMKDDPFIQLAAADLGIQWIVCCFSIVLRTEKFYDLTGSSTFVILCYLSYIKMGRFTLRQSVQTAFVMIWALRLGMFLFIRIMKAGKDRRFEQALKKPTLFFLFWTLQGIWVFITLLPTLMLNSEKYDPKINGRDIVGWSIWLVGFAVEVIADYQKYKFRSNPKNCNKFIQSGLWRYSRHPNYFGEILLWFGMYLSASSVLTGYKSLCVLAPIFDYFLITKFSGIPILEQQGLQKWGADQSYQNYIKRTNVLVPFFKPFQSL